MSTVDRNDAQAEIRLEIGTGDGEDSEELEQLTTRLRRELLELDVVRVERVPLGEPPPGTRAVDALAIGGLVVGLLRRREALTGVLHTVRDWLARDAKRTIKVEIDGDTLELTGASSADQERLVTAWIDRHCSR